MSAPGEVYSRVDTKILYYLHFTYPIFLLFYFLAAFTAHSIATASGDVVSKAPQLKGPGGKPLPNTKRPKEQVQGRKPNPDFSPRTKILFNWLTVGVVLTFLGNASVVILHALVDREHEWWCGKDMAIYVIAAFVAHGLLLISMIDTRPSPTIVHVSSWTVAILMELVLLGASISEYTSKHREPSAHDPQKGRLRETITEWEVMEILINILRIIFLFALLLFYVLFTAVWQAKGRRETSKGVGAPQESTRLLNGYQTENGNANGHAYGGTATSELAQPQPEAWSRPEKIPSKSWWEYLRGYSLFLPYIWPAKSTRLQVVFTICIILVIIMRVINVLVIYQVGLITNILAPKEGEPRIPWLEIGLYILYRFLQGGNGLLGALRGSLWIPISQYSYQELSTAAFEHVHSLSLDFHLGKKTGEVLSALSKGNSINQFLEQVTFQVVPMLIDLAVAMVYFLLIFDAYFALVIAIVTLAYLYVTIRLAQWRTDIRREMVNASRQEDAVKNDSMVSYETVKYFNAEQYEFQRYRKAVQDFQNAEYKVMMSLNIMNVCQNFIFTLGLLVTTLLAAYQVATGQKEVGIITMLLTYMAQLQGPLNFFGTFYRSMQAAMINAERMLELFKEKPTVVDDENARDFPTCQGEIRFADVQFSYNPKAPALKGVTFRCAPGTTTALVGESGGGKSTIFRLLFRFYQIENGSIQIDGHDLSDLKIEALRRHIGVVPQDTVLFNETLMYNLKYGNPSATDEEVYDACRAASIHEKIMGFADKYETRVGERGLKLSGGEKQRVAIARTILKNPRIILLDEATAALDTETESHIQGELNQLSKGRTTLVIAHRLSTITTADQILVLSGGKVVESGTHDVLLARKGKYHTMWRNQIKAQRAAEEAHALTTIAERLRNDIIQGDVSASQSEDDRKKGDDSSSSKSISSSSSSDNDSDIERKKNQLARANGFGGKTDHEDQRHDG
ncbi:hypothetical protein MMC25_003096 [Agyrium rufum]|nr:hypothetical protein [Agyrium rufum]